MKSAKLFLLFLLVSVLVISQAGMASAAALTDQAKSVSGTVQGITLETDPATGVITVSVSVQDKKGESHTVRLSQEKAIELGFVILDESGTPVINEEALGWEVDIRVEDIIPGDEVPQHPVGSALVAFFSDIPGLDYETIMSAREAGNGFGVIAQALWMTKKLGGDSEMLLAILEAKKTGDFSAFVLSDGSAPTGWGQFKKAVMDGDKKGNLGVVMSGKDKDKVNNGNGGDNGNAGNNGNANGNNKDKDKDKEKDNNGNKNKP